MHIHIYIFIDVSIYVSIQYEMHTVSCTMLSTIIISDQLLEAPEVGTNILYGIHISYCFIFGGSYYCMSVLEVELLC
jgi:hypothetical protein